MKLILNDCLLAMKEMPDNSVDSVVTDPPYGLSFMGKAWDYDVPKVEVWSEVLRVLKPGGYLLSFAGSRTYHRMAVNIEDAGFEIRDQILWIYGSGFPKSLNIGKAYDKKMGNERDVVGETVSGKILRANGQNERPYQQGLDRITSDITKGNSPYEGWGTALKPAHEPIVMARKPLIGTVVENVIAYGTGGINIDGCRVGTNPEVDDMLRTVERKQRETETWEKGSGFKNETNSLTGVPANGRFPANLIHDGSDEVVGLFPTTKSGKAAAGGHKRKDSLNYQSNVNYADRSENAGQLYGDSGSAARFFYCAKASKSERNAGLEDWQNNKPMYESYRANYETTHGIETPYAGAGRTGNANQNNHPTVKPVALMQYLVRLVTPPNGTVLDPFMGSGTTGIASKKENFDFIGIEMSQEYMTIAQARIDSA